MAIRPTEAKIRATKTIRTTRVLTMLSVGGGILVAAVLLGNVWSSGSTSAKGGSTGEVVAMDGSNKSINQLHSDALKIASNNEALKTEEPAKLVEDPAKCQFIVATENGGREEVHSRPEFLAVSKDENPSIYTLLRFAVRAPKGCGEIQIAGAEVNVSNLGDDFVVDLVGGEQGESDNVVNLLKVRNGFAGDQVFWFPFYATLQAGETRVFEVRISREEVIDDFADLNVYAVLQNPVEYYPEDSDELPQPFRVIIPNLPIR